MSQSISTYLFVPATNRKFIDHIIHHKGYKPDWYIFDFEDAIRDPNDFDNESSLKISARETLLSYMPLPEEIQKRYALRINPVDSLPFEADLHYLELTKKYPPHSIILPKVHSVAEIKKFEDVLPFKSEIIPLIESKEGLKNIDSILRVSHQIRSFCFGHIDYFFESKVFPIPKSVVESNELREVIEYLMSYAKKVKKQYIDAGFYYRGRWDEFKLHCSYLAYLGGGEVEIGKLVMHPDQIPHIKSYSLSPPSENPLKNLVVQVDTEDEIKKYAEDIVKAYENRPNKMSGVCLMNDCIITAQIYLLAKEYVS